MTDEKVIVTDEEIKKMKERYEKALEIEEHLKRYLYVKKFNKDNFHIIRCLAIFDNSSDNFNFGEGHCNLYQV